MGARLKMSQNNYSRIELDQINITLSTLAEIAGVLEIGIQEIMAFNETSLFRSPHVSETADAKTGYAPAQGPIVNLLQEEIVSLREDKKRLMSLLEKNPPRP
jgi:transcriptional regulator with XRE-family HTH domain